MQFKEASSDYLLWRIVFVLNVYYFESIDRVDAQPEHKIVSLLTLIDFRGLKSGSNTSTKEQPPWSLMIAT